MASSRKRVEVRSYLDPLEELHALVGRYDLSRKRNAETGVPQVGGEQSRGGQSSSKPLGAISGLSKGAKTSPPPPPPPPPPAPVFKPLSQSVYAPPHTLPHRDPKRIAASSRPRTNDNNQQQQRQRQQRQPLAPISMIREEKKWKEPEQAPVTAVVPTTTMVQKPKQTKQQAPVAVVAPTSTTTIRTTTTTTMVQKPKQTTQQAPSPPQQQPQRVWNGNGWTEPAGKDARKEEMRLAFRHVLRF